MSRLAIPRPWLWRGSTSYWAEEWTPLISSGRKKEARSRIRGTRTPTPACGHPCRLHRAQTRAASWLHSSDRVQLHPGEWIPSGHQALDPTLGWKPPQAPSEAVHRSQEETLFPTTSFPLSSAKFPRSAGIPRWQGFGHLGILIRP